jgi:hypothetical protein
LIKMQDVRSAGRETADPTGRHAACGRDERRADHNISRFLVP